MWLNEPKQRYGPIEWLFRARKKITAAGKRRSHGREGGKKIDDPQLLEQGKKESERERNVLIIGFKMGFGRELIKIPSISRGNVAGRE